MFVTGDRHAARVLSQQKEEFRRREADAIKAHFAGLRDRRDGAAPQATPLDLLRDIKRLNDHLVAGAAYPVLEAAGDLMPSRLAHGDEGPTSRTGGIRGARRHARNRPIVCARTFRRPVMRRERWIVTIAGLSP